MNNTPTVIAAITTVLKLKKPFAQYMIVFITVFSISFSFTTPYPLFSEQFTIPQK